MSKLAEHITKDGLGIIQDTEEKVPSYIAVVTFVHFLLESTGLTTGQLSEALSNGQRSKEYSKENGDYTIKVMDPVVATHAHLLVDNFLLRGEDKTDDE